MLLKSYHWLQHEAGGTLCAVGNYGAIEMRQMLVGAALACAAFNAAADSYREEVTPAEAMEVVAFWEGAGPALWFAKNDDFDRRFRERFFSLHEAAAHGALDSWNATPDGALALMILLDQYPRNAFRWTSRMYSTDAAARRLADAAIAASRRTYRGSFICPSVTPKTWPTRTAPSSFVAASVDETSPKLSTTATSCGGSAVSRIATRFSAGRRRRRNRSTSPAAATRDRGKGDRSIFACTGSGV